MIEDFLPVLREYGLVTIFWDVNFNNVYSRSTSGATSSTDTFSRSTSSWTSSSGWHTCSATDESTSTLGEPA
jgi:hypothetical protein